MESTLCICVSSVRAIKSVIMAGSEEFLKIVAFRLCFISVIVINGVGTHRLNVPRVLLPVFNDVSINFTLEVTEGGCYKWSSSRLDVIRLIPMNENFDHSCSSAVIVQTVTKEFTRNTAIVLAEDINTGQALRCDVIVDAIFSFNLVTTTRELFIEEAPEAFEVRSYDEQGNEFTTLAGVEFTWTIGNADKRSSQNDNKLMSNVLRFMTFQESPYETPSTVLPLDAMGKKGNIVLLEGVNTGTTKVSVRLSHPEYKHVPAIEVELIVVANLIILPSDVTMMAFDSAKYKVMQVHQGRLEEINLSSGQYYLETENPSILEINNDGCSCYALSLGKTKVLLHDKNVYEEYGVVLPSAMVNVNIVAYITLTVLPYRNLALILGRTHEIVVELFDSKDRKFYIGEGVEVTIDINNRFFEKQLTTQNGTHIVGIPIITGSTIVEASLLGVVNKEGQKITLEPSLTTTTELVIHSPVAIDPKLLVIPWDPKSKTTFEVTLRATGGDGSYLWSSRQSSVATVTQSGVVRIFNKGLADIMVSAMQNQYNKDTAKVYVLPVTRLEIVLYTMEAAVGETIYLHIALFGEIFDGVETKEIPFNDCKNIPLEVYIPDGNFVQNYGISEIPHPIGTACTTISIIGTNIGISSITVAYNTHGQYLMDNVTVSAYEPLRAIHPAHGETFLAVGSSRMIVFKGGPSSSTKQFQTYSKEIQISGNEMVEVTEHNYVEDRSSGIFVFKVICNALGETFLKFVVSNDVSLPNCKKADATATVRVACSKPRYIYLQPEFEEGNNCPIGRNADKIIARSNEDLELVVVVKDEDGKSFDNITSLNINWKLKPSSAGIFEQPTGSIEEVFMDMGVMLPKKHYQRIVRQKHIGSLGVTAKVIGYQKSILQKLEITPEWPPFPAEMERGTLATPLIEASVNVILVNDTVINPNRLNVLNDPNGKYFLQVSQGSGYYEFMLSSEDVADVRYIEPTKTISVVPKKSGILQIALVDLCLKSDPAEAVIEVQQLGGIEVDMVDKVEKGKCIVAEVKMYDTNGHIMILPSIEALDVRLQTENGYVEVKRLPISEQRHDPPYDSILYMIYGIEEGESRVTFTSNDHENDREIHSETIVVQVFLPLRVEPRNLTILIGTVYQILTTGGPTNSEIDFSTQDGDTLRVYRNGVVQGKSTGETRLAVRAVGISTKGNKVVYSQDYADIRVVILEGIKIIAPTLRIKVGAVIPLWAFGIPEHLTPLIIGSMKTPLRFIWTSSDSNLLSLHNMYEGTGINIRYQHDVTIRAKARKAGLATVYLNVTVPYKILPMRKRDVTFATFLKIEIFEEFSFIYPLDLPGVPVISMAPNSNLKLQTNRDKHGSATYKILTSERSSEFDETNALTAGSKSMTIDKFGIVKSGENLGRTVISVTNVETYGLKQSLTVIVDVKPIHYMMLSLKSNLHIRSGEELNMLPKGVDLNYIVEYYDNVGSKFHAAETKLEISNNRADLASFAIGAENSIHSKFFENGELVLKIYDDKYPGEMFDYVHMAIGDILFPTKTTLTVGDIICFSMPLLSFDGDPGYWQSSAPEYLMVDPITGIGRARNPGQAVVKHSLATQMQGEIDVTIQPIYKISLVPLRGKNISGMEVFSLPLVLKSKDEQIKENNILARGLGGCRAQSSFTLSSFPFTCNIQFLPLQTSIRIKDLFLAKPRFDIVTGFYYCDIIPVTSPTIALSTLDISVQINAQSREIIGSPIEIPYLPPIYLDTKEIVFITSLSDALPTALLEIHGLQSILERVIIEAPAGLTVSGSQFISKQKVLYKIRLVQNRDEVQSQKIIVISDLTKQQIYLSVRVSRYDQFSPVYGMHWLDYIHFHRYTLGTFIVLMVTFFYLWRNKTTSVNLTVQNKSVFIADKSPPPIRKSYTPISSTTNNVTSTPSSRSPNTSLRPFSVFEPVYGDPRGFYTPTSRRNKSLHSP